ncbi:AAA family ATPase [Veillonella caviae]|uniref:AAA family ATPase n=1 Tax=Veillonella caviae TaxID=248316 RepID=UPI000F8F6225|nr:AAA family ATPase [Veillonella caviae]
MRLIKLELLNFKGLEQFEFEFDGLSATIRGDNATGKTTLFDAMCWLLFGKDSLDRADFQLKTLRNGEPIHKVNHEVTGTFKLDDGRTVELKRVFREKYSSPRGGDVQLTGHTTDYFIDGVPSKEKEYKAFINSLISEDVFKLITNPLYFNEQYSWQNRRKLLLEMCGDIDDQDVIKSRSDLNKLTQILNGRNVEDHRKVVAAKKTAINKELDMIPIRIDEAIRNKPEILCDKAKLEIDIKNIENGIKDLEEQKALIEHNLANVERESQIKALKRTIKAREGELRGEHIRVHQYLHTERNNLFNELQMLRHDCDRHAKRIDELIKDIAQCDARIERLKTQFDTVNSREFNSELCPTCYQPLPEDKQKELEVQFNMNKSRELDEIQMLLKSQQNLKSDYLQQQDLISTQYDNANTELMQWEVKYNDAMKAYAEHQEPNIDEDAVYIDLQAQLFMLESAMDDNNGDELVLAKIDGDIVEMKDKRNLLERELNKYKMHADIDARVAELEAEQQRLVNEKNELDEASFLMDEFVKAKVEMLEQSINSRFKLARFKMFNTLVNGGIEECCETTYNGVPYRSMNNAARINVGLDIINALTDFYKVSAPVFVDNAEAVTEFTDVNSQVIYLVVDGNFEELTII